MTINETADMMQTAIVFSRLPACADASAHTVTYTVLKLARLGRAAQRLAENLCNVPVYQEAFDRGMASVRKHAVGALHEMGISAEVETGGDPRGSCLKVRIAGASEFRF